MTKRENLMNLLRRKGYKHIPVEFSLCPSLEKEYTKNICSDRAYHDYFEFPWVHIPDIILPGYDESAFVDYYDIALKPGTMIDHWGVAHEPGSEAAKHMTYMRHPMQKFTSVEQMMAYPYPDYLHANSEHQKVYVGETHKKGLAAVGNLHCTIWETSWYMRGMMELMVDMMNEDPMAIYILDKVTELSIQRAKSFAQADVDILFLGDDIGMQSTIMMSEELYTTWLKPRLMRVIREARAIKPDILIAYHSCGFVEPLIPHLIDAGIDVLNPIQPECMKFQEIHEKYGDRISFLGTIGTQTTMPFGSPDDVRRTVFKNLETAGDKGGLFPSPTHLLEPEVPWDNILAYVKACNDFTG